MTQQKPPGWPVASDMHSSAVFKRPREDEGPHKCNLILSRSTPSKQMALALHHGTTVMSRTPTFLLARDLKLTSAPDGWTMPATIRTQITRKLCDACRFRNTAQRSRILECSREIYIVRHSKMAWLSHSLRFYVVRQKPSRTILFFAPQLRAYRD